MYKKSIKLKFIFIPFFLGFIFTPTIIGAEVNYAISLSKNLKEVLIKSTPILGKNVTKKTFSEQPILINFFASW